MSASATPADVFKALGDEHRLRMLEFVATGDPSCCSTGRGICACDIQEHVGLAQPTVSHHMRLLTEAGLVTGEKRGKWVYYTLNPAGFDVAREVAGRFLALSPRLVELEVA